GPAEQLEPRPVELRLEELGCQAVHCVAVQVVASTVKKMTRIWPQRILVADIAESFPRGERWSQAEPLLAAEAPVDAAVAAREAGDMAAKLLFE
ncbi:MAG: hypothetical protein FD152_3615, partial [Xanthobacteraceae bacterium]